MTYYHLDLLIKVISRKIFVSAVAKKTNMTQEEVKSVLNSSISFIKEVVMADKEVRFANFGTFKLKKISARRRRNPSTGDYFEASAKTKLQFKSSPKWDKSDEEDAEN
ncbi:HU family DNA-binding protein [archaeon]|nr:MAG: HU family DNA-binding protein [archaeon]